MPVRFVPHFDRRNYQAIQRLIGDHPTLPSAYNEWLKLAADQVDKLHAEGHVVNRPEIDADEFTRFCHNAGHNPDLIWLMNFVAMKAKERH